MLQEPRFGKVTLETLICNKQIIKFYCISPQIQHFTRGFNKLEQITISLGNRNKILSRDILAQLFLVTNNQTFSPSLLVYMIYMLQLKEEFQNVNKVIICCVQYYVIMVTIKKIVFNIFSLFNIALCSLGKKILSMSPIFLPLSSHHHICHLK